MSINSMFQAGTDMVLDDQVRRPQPVQPTTPSFSLWDAVKSPFQGGGGGVAKGIAFNADVIGAFGDVLGAYPEAMGGPITDKQRAEGEAARRKLLTQGVDYSSDTGDLFRQTAKDILPDPATTHWSAVMTANLFDIGTRALGYGLTLGPMAPLAFGGDTALEASDDLKHQGVDLATRTKAGATTGLINAATLMVPMAAATRLRAAGTGVAVGESAIVGQSLATKAILNNAGYDKIADRYDPLDPVALAVGLVPGAFGFAFHSAPSARPLPAGAKPLGDMGLGERQALPYNDARLDAYAVQAAQREGVPPEALLAIKNVGEKSGPTATSPAGAQGVMQFMPDTFKAYGRGDPMDPINSIDAGAKYLKALIGQYGGDVRAALAHYNGGTAAGKAVRDGGLPPSAETQAYLARTDAFMGAHGADSAARSAIAADADVVRAARVNLTAAAIDDMRLTADDDWAGMDAHVDALQQAHDQIARGEDVNVLDRLPLDRLDEQRANALLDAIGRDTDGPEIALHSAMAVTGEPGYAPQPLREPTVLDQGAPQTVAQRSAGPAPAGTRIEPTLGPADPLQRPAPVDRPVLLDGMEAPLPRSQLLDQVRQQAVQESADANLIQVAAECFLTIG